MVPARNGSRRNSKMLQRSRVYPLAPPRAYQSVTTETRRRFEHSNRCATCPSSSFSREFR